MRKKPWIDLKIHDAEGTLSVGTISVLRRAIVAIVDWSEEPPTCAVAISGTLDTGREHMGTSYVRVEGTRKELIKKVWG